MEKIWKIDISNEELAQANSLKQIIHDVYVDGNSVVIEHTLNCKEFKSDKKLRKMRIPLALKNTDKLTCKRKDEYSCLYSSCIIILAAYSFYLDKINSNFDTIVDIDVWADDEEEEKEEIVEEEEITEDNILEMFEEKELEDYKDLIYGIKEDEFLTLDLKKEFFSLIKSLINYKSVSLPFNPSFGNYVISENTDTVNNVCLGQNHCLEILKKIWKTFNCVSGTPKVKFVNFRELSMKDSLLDKENYEEEIIVLTNLYYLTHKNLIRGGESTQENSLNIKNNFPSFILSHPEKMFIICDKEVNIKEFFAHYQQLFFNFRQLHIPDLKEEQIHQIFMIKLKKNESIQTTPDFEDKLWDYLDKNYIYSPYKNLEFIDFVFKSGVRNMIEENKVAVLDTKYFPIFRNDATDEFTDLENMVGLGSVKEEIKNLKSYLAFKKEKENYGDRMPDLVLHMAFFGNPGTGKTTVARLMTGILFNMGFIRYNKCIECESKDLISNVPGETAIKTAEKIQEAMGGVLFIDETYAIGESSAYGSEAISVLIKAMEDYKNDLVVILAGYRTEMLRFLEINSGFLSRIAYQLEFEDYDISELIDITRSLFARYNMVEENYEVFNRIEQIYSNEKRKDARTFGNARFVRTTVEKILKNHAVNIEVEEDIHQKMHLITIDDVKLM